MKYLVIALIAIIFALGGGCAYLISLASELKTIAKINNAVVESQNAAIEQIIIDTEKYHCDLESMNEYAKSKYEKVMHDSLDESCESKLNELEKALNIYGGES